jgi:hypothetical protein
MKSFAFVLFTEKSDLNVVVIPESPSVLLIGVLLILALVSAVPVRKKNTKQI